MANLNETLPTNKIKISQIVTEETRVDKEIDLPYYFKKRYDSIAKVDNDQRVISVMTLSSYWTISVSEMDNSERAEIAKGTPCTEAEFNAAFQTALSKIQNTNL